MILGILEDISGISGTNDKLNRLMGEVDNYVLREVCRLCYSGDINFYIKKVPVVSGSGDSNLSDILRGLDKLYNREITGNAGIEYLVRLMGMLSERDCEVLRRVISRDLRIGMGIKQINKVWRRLS